MNYNYDDERPGAHPPGGEAPETHAPYNVDEDILPKASDTQGYYTPHAAYGEPSPPVPHVEAPVEFTPPSPPDSAEYQEPARPQPWRDPSFSSVPDHGPTVYSPGIQPPYQPRHKPEPREERAERYDSGGGRRHGGFLRAVCLVVVCALASAGATLGVLEYKADDTEQAPPTNQTQSAGSSDRDTANNAATPSPGKTEGTIETPPFPGVVTRPMINPGMTLTAQEIYEMACQQVVVVRTVVSSQGGGFFGQSGSSLISGSGFIIREDGYIVTNYHVVEAAYRGSGQLMVALNDGEAHDATIIGVEPGSDVAVIKIEATGLVPVTIGDSGAMRVGESVYAVGNPLGELIYTITDGIISALDREITVESTTMNMFQISAAVNSGNSGGPVYDSYGSVIGVVTAKFNNSMVEGIGFAIPINDAMRIAGQLMENGYIVDSKAYMGITAKTVDSATAEYYEWVVGAYVLSVEPGSCADKAGLKVGDIITQVGSITVTSQDSLVYAKKCFNAGDTTELTVRRTGEDLTLTITFDEEPAAEQ